MAVYKSNKQTMGQEELINMVSGPKMFSVRTLAGFEGMVRGQQISRVINKKIGSINEICTANSVELGGIE